eukprot:9496248-Pyramimonas_sp.AAC.3
MSSVVQMGAVPMVGQKATIPRRSSRAGLVSVKSANYGRGLTSNWGQTHKCGRAQLLVLNVGREGRAAHVARSSATGGPDSMVRLPTHPLVQLDVRAYILRRS